MELTFSKRECRRFVAGPKDGGRCACGATWAHHKTHGVDVDAVGAAAGAEVWSPAHHTVSSPTDAFGTIDFLGGPHPNKAQFIRLGERRHLLFLAANRRPIRNRKKPSPRLSLDMAAVSSVFNRVAGNGIQCDRGSVL